MIEVLNIYNKYFKKCYVKFLYVQGDNQIWINIYAKYNQTY